MIRLLALLLLFLMPATPQATAQPSRELSEMPVMVLYCDTDPGRINPGGGRGLSPEQLLESGGCTPAEGVSLTFVLADTDWDFEKDKPAEEIEWNVQEDGWFDRCDIDAGGMCALNSPVGFDIVIGVVLHENTVKPGYTPAFFPSTTHNYTEFAGYGLALIPDAEYTGTGTETADHQTLALNITQSDAPAKVLTEWQFNDEADDTYLATNTDGWASNVIAAGDHIKIDLVNVGDDAQLTVGCSGVDDRSIVVEYEVDDEGDLVIDVPDTASDIRCDITIEE
jgi:hypothetical protein